MENEPIKNQIGLFPLEFQKLYIGCVNDYFRGFCPVSQFGEVLKSKYSATCKIPMNVSRTLIFLIFCLHYLCHLHRQTYNKITDQKKNILKSKKVKTVCVSFKAIKNLFTLQQLYWKSRSGKIIPWNEKKNVYTISYFNNKDV